MTEELRFAHDWNLSRVRLVLSLSASSVDVATELEVESNTDNPGPLVLDGRNLITNEVCVNDTTLGFERCRIEATRLEIDLPPGRHTVSTKVRAPVGRPGDKGFVHHDGLLSTNLEPQGFRRITWFPDSPRVRVPFDVTLEADVQSFPTMLTNGVRIDGGQSDDGRHWVRYQDPVPKPSYLFSAVAGTLALRSAIHTSHSGEPITITVAAPPQLIEGSDFALWAMDEVMSFDEANGGVPHDLPELVFVAVPGYPDATEYHGLMFFDPALLIADPSTSTDDDILVILANVAHEYGHHVRGNRVTVSSWDQLALKEGLTVLTAQNDFRRHILGEAARILDVLDLRRLQFPEESTIGAPVVRPPSADPTSLYTRTTYLKGAEIFGMLRRVLGEQSWNSTFAEFVRRHDLGSAAIEDFVAVAKAVRPDLSATIDGVSRWFSIIGRPAVTINWDESRGVLSAKRSDALRDDPPVAIPLSIGFLASDGSPTPARIEGTNHPSEAVLVLEGREKEWRVETPVPTVITPMRGFSAPIDFEVSESNERLALIVRCGSDPFVRWWASEELMIRVVNQFRSGDSTAASSTTEALAEVLTWSVDSIDDPVLLAQILALPDEYMLGDRDTTIDVDGVATGLTFLRHRLGLSLSGHVNRRIEKLLRSDLAVSRRPDALAARMLLEPCFALLVASGELDLATRAMAHSEPTVALRAFTQIAHSDAINLDEIAESQFVRWGNHPRLVDRWIRALSGSRRLDTIDRVERLVRGPLYERSNRSRVMALWFPFATRNRAVFHHQSGRGYRIFVDELAELMPDNPGTAIRLVGDLLQFKRFDSNRNALMRSELTRLTNVSGMPDFAVAVLRDLLA